MSDPNYNDPSAHDYIPPPPPLPLDYLYDMRLQNQTPFAPYPPFEHWCHTHHMPTTMQNGGASSNEWTIHNRNDPTPTILPGNAQLVQTNDWTNNPRYLYITYHTICSEMYRYYARNVMTWPDSFHFTIPEYINNTRTSSAMLTPCWHSGTDIRADYQHFQFPNLFNNMRPVTPPVPSVYRFAHQISYSCHRDREPTNLNLVGRFLTTSPLPFMPHAPQYMNSEIIQIFRDMLAKTVPRLHAVSLIHILPNHHPYLTYLDSGDFTSTGQTIRLLNDYDQLVSAQRAILSPGLLFNMIAKSARRGDPAEFANAVKSQCEPGTDDLLERYGADIFVRIYQHLSDSGWPDLEDMLDASCCDYCCRGESCGDCQSCHTDARVEELQETISNARHALDSLKEDLDV